MQMGAGYSVGLRWREIDIVFESRTDQRGNKLWAHRQFLEDAREIVLERVQIVIQKHNNIKHHI